MASSGNGLASKMAFKAAAPADDDSGSAGSVPFKAQSMVTGRAAASLAKNNSEVYDLPLELLRWFPSAATASMHDPVDETRASISDVVTPPTEPTDVSVTTDDDLVSSTAAEDDDVPGLDVESIQEWAKDHANDVDTNGANGLHWSCFYNQPVALSILLRRGANVHAETKEGNTPLHYACSANSTSCLKLLMEAKADINKGNNLGETPVHLTCMHNHTSCLALLIKQKADVFQRDEVGATGLHIACHYDASRAAEMLMAHEEAEKLVQERDSKGATALMWAARKNSMGAARVLWTGKARELLHLHVNATNNHGDTALSRAAFYNSKQFVYELMQVCAGSGADDAIELDVNTANKDGDTALISACYKNNYGVVQALFKGAKDFGHDLDASVINKQQESALHWACLHNSVIATKLLLSVPNLDVNTQDMNGNTPLHIAWRYDALECAELLLSFPNRPDFSIHNNDGVPSAELASPEGRDTFDEIGRACYAKGTELMAAGDADAANYEFSKALHYYQQRVCEKLNVLVEQTYHAKAVGFRGKNKSRGCMCVVGLGGVFIQRVTKSFLGDVKRKSERIQWTQHAKITRSDTSVTLDLRGDASVLVTLDGLHVEEALWLYSLMVMASFLHAYLWATTRPTVVMKRLQTLDTERRSALKELAQVVELQDEPERKNDTSLLERKTKAEERLKTVKAQGEKLRPKISTMIMTISRVHQRILVAGTELGQLAKIQKKLADAATTASAAKEYEETAQELLDAAAVCDIEAMDVARSQANIDILMKWLENDMELGKPLPLIASVTFVVPNVPESPKKAQKEKKPEDNSAEVIAMQKAPPKDHHRRPSHLLIRQQIHSETPRVRMRNIPATLEESKNEDDDVDESRGAPVLEDSKSDAAPAGALPVLAVSSPAGASLSRRRLSEQLSTNDSMVQRLAALRARNQALADKTKQMESFEPSISAAPDEEKDATEPAKDELQPPDASGHHSTSSTPTPDPSPPSTPGVADSKTSPGTTHKLRHSQTEEDFDAPPVVVLRTVKRTRPVNRGKPKPRTKDHSPDHSPRQSFLSPKGKLSMKQRRERALRNARRVTQGRQAAARGSAHDAATRPSTRIKRRAAKKGTGSRRRVKTPTPSSRSSVRRVASVRQRTKKPSTPRGRKSAGGPKSVRAPARRPQAQRSASSQVSK